MRNTISRTDAASKNLRSSAAGIFINLIFSFFSRKIFVLVLGKEFVGLGSLIGNMTAVLSLVDFGAAGAVTYRLYLPLARGDTEKVSAYLCAYSRVCRISAVLTLFGGLLSAPLLPMLADGFSGEKNLYTVFFIYILMNASGYIFSREKILLLADQKNYVNQLFSYLFGGITVISESLVLIATQNYIAYISVHAVLCFAEDICVAVFVRKKYPHIDFSGRKKPDCAVEQALKREMLMLQPSNISGTFLRTADNFLVVHLFGVAANGMYSNYNMLLSYASMLSVTLVGALSASVGNLGAVASKKRASEVFGITSLASFFLVNICTCVLFVMSGDIITLWLGKGLVLSRGVSSVLAVHFFISGLRSCTLLFRNSYGLYKKEKIKPFAELFLSLFLSSVLGKKYGIGGIYAGQAISSFFLCLWYEPYILFRHGFSMSPFGYYLTVVRYFAICAVSCGCSFAICRILPSFTLRILVCVFVPALFSCGAFAGRADMRGILKTLGLRVLKKYNFS